MSVSRRTNGQQVNHFSSSRDLEREIGKDANEVSCVDHPLQSPVAVRMVLLTGLVELMRRATTKWAPTFIRVRVLPHSLTTPSCSPCISIMTDSPRQQKGRGRVVPALDMAIASLNIAKEATSTTPVNPVFGSVAILLTMIRVSSFPSCDVMFRVHT